MNQKTKLLLVADTYYPKVDGTVKFIEEFVKRSKEKFQIHLLVPKFAEEKQIAGIKTSFLKTSKIFQPLPTYPAVKVLSFRNLVKIKRSVKEAEIVFVQGPAIASCLAIRYSRKYKKKVFFYTHLLPWELLEKSKSSGIWNLIAHLVKKVSIRFYNRCDQILVPYHELKEQLQQEGLKTSTIVARLGVDIERFSLAKDKAAAKRKVGIKETKTVIGYVGRISKEKNTKILLEAFQKLPVQRNYFLLMVGDGDPELVKRFKEIKNGKVTGFVKNVEIFLRATDIFVMPSLTETTSLATLEAMSSGLPVITTKVGFMKSYIVKDYNGLFFPRNSSTVLAMKIKKLLEDEALREKLGHNARKTVAYSFSWERSINKIKRILTEQ